MNPAFRSALLAALRGAVAALIIIPLTLAYPLALMLGMPDVVFYAFISIIGSLLAILIVPIAAERGVPT